MRATRIVAIDSETVEVGVICDCGCERTEHMGTYDCSVSHPIVMDSDADEQYLVCANCEKKFLVESYGDHVLVTDAH